MTTQPPGQHGSFVPILGGQNGSFVPTGTTGRPRKYATDAERKRAYRQRRKRPAIDLAAKGIRHLEWLNDEEVKVTMSGEAFLEKYVSIDLQAYISLLRKSVCPICGGSAWRRLPDGRERCAAWESEKETKKCPGTRALYAKACSIAATHGHESVPIGQRGAD